MTLKDFINNVVDLDGLNYQGDVKTKEELKLNWQDNYKVYVTFRHQSNDKAYSLLKYINNTFKRFDVLPSFSYFEEYSSNYLTFDELISGLWILLLVYRNVSDIDIKKIQKCGVVDTVEVVSAVGDARKMNIVKIKYFHDKYRIEIDIDEDEKEIGEVN